LAVGVDAAFEGRSTMILRYLDVALVAVVAIPALALGAPVFGYAVGAGAWILQRIVAATDRRLVRNAGASPHRQVWFNLFEAFGRIWLLAGAILLAALAGGRADGLTAALLILGAYSIAFAVRLLSGPPPPRPAP
jgi:hypothetical protein